ncbi:MAG TPA: hypothetical protein VGR73_10440 [Bryobacteraceae bacterium]|nr:hypothetical protein [Bryobacteraceae bacterium]
MDYINGCLWYGVEIGGSLHFLKTGPEALQPNELPHGITAAGSITGSPISNDGIKRFLQRADVDGAKLIRELANYFAQHAKFNHETIPAVLAHWVVAGYAYAVFPFFPYLSLTSAQPSCGKSRVLELLTEVAFRANPIITNSTSAVVYRSLHDNAQVMLIDEFEDATEDGKKAMIAVLNSGFKRGAMVPRCHGDNHDIKHFHAYSPKAFAGLARIPEALKTRSIPILMMPKTPELLFVQNLIQPLIKRMTRSHRQRRGRGPQSFLPRSPPTSSHRHDAMTIRMLRRSHRRRFTTGC